MNKADSLNLLTREGKLLRNQIDTIYHLMNHRWGDLTPLGARQHRDMARRMYHRFRPAFTPQDGKVTLVAQSTTVPRSIRRRNERLYPHCGVFYGSQQRI